MNGHSARRPRVVIVGGGMGGIAAAKTLANAPVEITLVDGHNYYLFQPLLYEVAGAIVSTEDVTHAIRGLLRGQANIHFRLATADVVDLEQQQVTLHDGEQLRYEYLILATGLRSDVARVPGAAEHAFPMKTLEDALALRNHLLRRLETAAAHPELVAAGALDIVIVGGSTTGVEVVAAFSEIYNHALRQEFPEIDFTQTKITLVEAGDALLPMFHPNLRRWVEKVLTQNGTEVRLRSPVAEIGPASVTLESGEEIPAGTIIVATGVRATALADRLGIAQAASGRVVVNPNLSIPGHPEAFAIGDMAALPERRRDAPPGPRPVRAPGRPPRRTRNRPTDRTQAVTTVPLLGQGHELDGRLQRRDPPERPHPAQGRTRLLPLGHAPRLLRPRLPQPPQPPTHLALELGHQTPRRAAADREPSHLSRAREHR